MRSVPHKNSPVLASIVCCSLCLGGLPAPAAVKVAPAKKLTRGAQIDLLLNRFTFGPSATDRKAVEQLGIDGWLERQLSTLR